MLFIKSVLQSIVVFAVMYTVMFGFHETYPEQNNLHSVSVFGILTIAGILISSFCLYYINKRDIGRIERKVRKAMSAKEV